jgi:hypothetical protein
MVGEAGAGMVGKSGTVKLSILALMFPRSLSVA